jgi:hypothetical protein
MDRDYQIKILLDDEKMKKLIQAGLDIHIIEEECEKLLKITLPQKNQRKFKKAFPKAVLNEQTGQVDKFPEDAASMLFDAIIEYKTLDVIQFFLLKAFKPLAGKEIRRAIH